ncbi:PREDICTED: growth-regulating factor 4-like isoform X1 [Populus euphratica]|uniref:Growth-regulating factor n=1 Tax=Populus euphratica TaxID=75702 RepID=A0AAJ6UFA1_POPEU|nr:PREDICTED: growth-regulating factor 4-like isoform X1 [Populus euphratica]XP_011028067.1 PREDICTED: growth-regulating factor 4-like isoform X1 [Populus euphratica]
MSNSSVTVAAVGSRSPPGFTVSQWHELEHQVRIFKCLDAGLPVPPNLLVPICKSFQLLSPGFLHPSNLSYCSYFGKKIDSEPGRCRRTDGKKWRCSKDAHPDSKYCERHMNRSRNRSRKPVESQTTSQSLSTVASEIATGSSSSGSRGYPTNPGTLGLGSNMSRWQMESMPYGVNSKDYRSLHGPKLEADEKTFLPEALGNTRSFGMNSTVDSTWHLTSQVPANPVPESRNGAQLQNYPQVQTLQDFEPLTDDAASSKQQQQHYLFGREFSSSGSMRRENQPLQPLFEEWPKCRDMDSYLTDQRSNNNSSAVQLSMAIPMAPNPAARSYHSPNGETDA